MKKKQHAQQTPAADVKDAGRRTIYQRLHLLSLSKGICIALALVLASVPVGNARELNRKLDQARRVWEGTEIDGKAIPADQQLPVSQIIEGRAAAAANLLTVMKRYPDAAVIEREALDRARIAMKNAGDPKSTAQANAALQTCVTEAMAALPAQASVSSEDYELLRQVAASFNEQANRLAIRIRDYDRQMQKAIDTYDDLPSRGLFPRPELFGEL